MTQEDFEEALDSILLGTRQTGSHERRRRRLVAYHEGGHAIVARLTPGADPVQRVDDRPARSGARRHRAATGRGSPQLPARLPDGPARRLARRPGRGGGGLRPADDGAESDLKAATSLARRMVGLWGMTDEVGPVSYGVGETQPFLGRELSAPREYAEATGARIDEAVAEIITTARIRRPRSSSRPAPRSTRSPKSWLPTRWSTVNDSTRSWCRRVSHPSRRWRVAGLRWRVSPRPRPRLPSPRRTRPRPDAPAPNSLAQPNVKQYASTPASRNSISTVRSAIAPGWRISW